MSGSGEVASVLTKRDALPWFEAELRESGLLDRPGIYRAFELAWEHTDGALPERWRGWVRQAVQQAKSNAKSNPGGLLLEVLRNGPRVDLSEAASAEHDETPAETRARWTREDLERQKREAAELPFAGRKTRPPLWLGLRAVEAGRDPHEVYEAWEAAGFPPPEEFQGPALLEG